MSPDPRLDQPVAVRPGEEVDAAALTRWLAAAGVVPAGTAPAGIEQFPSGYSNLTYRVRAGGRDLVLRRPPVGSEVATAHDMGREHWILSRLAGGRTSATRQTPADPPPQQETGETERPAPVFELAPRPLAYCDDPAVLGAPFYIMERVEGLILRARPVAGVELDRATARRLSESFVAVLARLHAVDVEAAGLAEIGKPGYTARQVHGWVGRWQAARLDEVPQIEAVTGWLAARADDLAEGAPALVHNDFKYDNLVLDPDDPPRVKAVLDWEMATVGDPLLDLGTALGYWIEAGDPEAIRRFRFGPTDLPGSLGRGEIAERWSAATGREITDLPFCYAFGLFKIAVIAQQIYARYARGLTRDPRFAALPAAVAALGRRAAEVAGGAAV